jgi:hypothetical protein
MVHANGVVSCTSAAEQERSNSDAAPSICLALSYLRVGEQAVVQSGNAARSGRASCCSRYVSTWMTMRSRLCIHHHINLNRYALVWMPWKRPSYRTREWTLDCVSLTDASNSSVRGFLCDRFLSFSLTACAEYGAPSCPCIFVVSSRWMLIFVFKS